MDERLIRLFEEELRHLRETAAEFGRAFPNRAKHLDPRSKPFEGKVEDPYVERLLEGVAFLAARVRLKLDAQFPQFTQGLLETLYPDFLAPVPSMAVFQLEPDPSAPPPPEGEMVSRGTIVEGFPLGQKLPSSAKEATGCAFSLGCDVRLLPVELIGADWLVRRLHEVGLSPDWNARAALRLKLRKREGAGWKDIRLDPLVIHVPKGDGLGYEIMEQLFSRQAGLTLRCMRDGRWIPVLEAKGQLVQKFGFDAANALLPSTARGFEGHRLLREYFALPEKFLFFELRDFGSALAECEGDEIEIVIALEEASTRLERQVTASCFRLFCAPAVNLFKRQFSQVIEPNQSSEFHLMPDANRPLDYEVYSVESIEGFIDSSPYGQVFKPFFEAHHLRREGNAFFTLTRQPRSRSESSGLRAEAVAGSYAGSEVSAALVDFAQVPFNGSINLLTTNALVSNRHLPLALAESPARWVLTGGSKARVMPLVGPTSPSFQPVDGAYAWRLLNLFAVNYFAVSGADAEKENASALKELLALYAGGAGDWATQQIAAMRGVSSCSISRPLYEQGEAGAPPRVVAIVRGLEISLVFEDSAFLDLGVVLLGSVLEEFFARSVAINSFAETVMKTPDGRERMRWPARPGLKPLV